MEYINIDQEKIDLQHSVLEAARESGCRISALQIALPSPRDIERDDAVPRVTCTLADKQGNALGSWHGTVSEFIWLCNVLKSGTLPRPREGGPGDHGWRDPR